MGQSPLSHPRLMAIERKLDEGALEEAQHLLAQLGDGAAFRYATAYLSTRLLFQRGHLDERGVVERLERLLEEVGDFPEAFSMLEAARLGTLDRHGGSFKTARPPPAMVEHARSSRPPERETPPKPVELPDIPRAGRVPEVEPATASETATGGATDSIPDLMATGGVRKSPPPPPAPAPRPAEHIRSAAPPQVAPARPSLFEIASLLDENRFDDALDALARRGPSDDPDHVLMEARVLDRAGRSDEALQLVRRLGHAPLLESDVRATVARLALDLGDVDLALAQASRAERDDPLHPMVRLSFAWAAIRKARRTADFDLVLRAKKALGDLRGVGGVYEGVLSALGACVEAHMGDATRALALSDYALGLEKTADGLAARAMALARLGRAGEARDAALALQRASPTEAGALERSLEQFGERLFCPPTGSSVAPAGANADAASVWGPLELAVVERHFDQAWLTFAQLAEDTFARLSRTAVHEAPALAAVAASFLTVAPISRDFAPYDETPWSLGRLEALLDLLAQGAARVFEPEHPLVALLGAYVGEVLRQAFDGRWCGSVSDRADVSAPSGTWNAFRMVSARIGERRPFGTARLIELLDGASRQVKAHAPAVAPPCPWDPAPWPAPDRVPALGRALSHSVIAVHCSMKAGIELDGSLSSLRGIDAYLDLIAPPAAPHPADGSALRRAATLTGAYLGEVLRDLTGSHWTEADSLALGPGSYALRLTSGETVQPIAHALARLYAGAPSVSEWARGVVDRAE
jgi:tetratricopeptide (TPR) repeat protein